MGADVEIQTLDDSFRQVIDLIPALAWSSRPDGSADYFNQVWLDYTGLSPADAVDWGWTAAIHPEDRDRMGAYWQIVLATGEPAEIEARLRRFDGEYRWFLFRARSQRDESGRIVKWYGTNTDIEDRKQAEDALRASELNFRLIVDTIPALVCTMMPAGELEVVNQQILDYFGKTRDELTDWASIGAVHDDDLADVTAKWRYSIDTGHPYDVEHRIRRSDGVHRWFHVRGLPLRDTQGRTVRWYLLLVDIDERKQAEDALRKGERELRQLVDSVPGMIATANARGEHEYANKRALDYTGTTIEASRGLGFVNAIHPAEQDLVRTEWLRCSQLGVPMDINHRWRRFDGVYRWFHVRVEPLMDDSGQMVRWYGLLTDIEDRRRAEESLSKSEQHLRLLVETIPALLWRATPAGDIDYVNPRLLDYTGFLANELLRSGWAPFLHPDDRDAEETWRHNCETGKSHELTCRLRRADGAYRWFQVRGEPLRNSDGHILNWYGLMLDIDDNKRAEQALQEREDHLRLITETIPAIVTSRDANGNLDYVNQRLIDFTGTSVQEILASGAVLVHPDDREKLLQVWRDSQKSGEYYELAYRMRGADGSYRWFQLRGAPLRDRVGSVSRWYEVITDIEDGRRAREELVKSQMRLARMSQVMTVAELSASIAHEINQPLASVVANGHACVTWLSGDSPNLERARVTGERIIRDGNAAAEVVRRIRALFKQAPPALALSDINEIVGEVLKLIGDEILDSGITVHTDLASGLPMVVVDRIQIQQSLINLVRNAIEAMDDVVDRPKALSLVSRQEGTDILIQVRDTGCGLANPASMFEPFFTTKEEGMGMGLAICRSIIEVHGGRLGATQNDGAGATFSFTLPTQPEEAG